MKVYGNNLEIQAMAEMYNRPIHIYSYSTGTTCGFLAIVPNPITSWDFTNIEPTKKVATCNVHWHKDTKLHCALVLCPEPINIFHGSYETDLPPIRLSYHRSNHYNSLLDPCNPAVGAGLGFGSLCGVGTSLCFPFCSGSPNNFF